MRYTSVPCNNFVKILAKQISFFIQRPKWYWVYVYAMPSLVIYPEDIGLCLFLYFPGLVTDQGNIHGHTPVFRTVPYYASTETGNII